MPLNLNQRRSYNSSFAFFALCLACHARNRLLLSCCQTIKYESSSCPLSVMSFKMLHKITKICQSSFPSKTPDVNSMVRDKQLSKAINYGSSKRNSCELACEEILITDNSVCFISKFRWSLFAIKVHRFKTFFVNHKAVGDVAVKWILLLEVCLGWGTVKTVLMALSKLHNYMAVHY